MRVDANSFDTDLSAACKNDLERLNVLVPLCDRKRKVKPVIRHKRIVLAGQDYFIFLCGQAVG